MRAISTPQREMLARMMQEGVSVRIRINHATGNSETDYVPALGPPWPRRVTVEKLAQLGYLKVETKIDSNAGFTFRSYTLTSAALALLAGATTERT